ncbi:MAG TPA: DsbC family protein [Geobacteraceae bacterium]|nr:DsbC family protein [Geobacteraceae bacterium]
MIKKFLFAVSVIAFSSSAIASDNFASVRESLQKAFPKAPVNGIRQTPIDGLYEIQSGDNIFYYCPKSENIVLGEIYTKEGKNLTAEARNVIIEKKVGSIDTSKAIKIGSGKNIVIEFTDPDCPFCRKSFEFWKTKKDITHYIFLNPVPSLHPKATEKAEWILSQKDKVAAFNDVFSGKFDKTSPQGITEEGKNLLKEQLQIAAKVQINGTPMFFVNNKFIPGANFSAIDQALSAGPGARKVTK